MTSHSVIKTISLVVSDISKAKEEDGLKLLKQGALNHPFQGNREAIPDKSPGKQLNLFTLHI